MNYRQQIDLILKATAQGTEKMRDEIGRIGEETSEASRQAGIGNLRWTELNSAFSLVTGTLSTLYSGLQQAYGVIKETAALEQAEQQFNNLTESIGSTSDSMMTSLRTATSGMVSDAELMANASQLISLGLADTEQGTAELANTISKLGLNMSEVILTFSNNSKMRLDALGLSVEDVDKRVEELNARGFDGDAFDQAVMDALAAKMELLGDASETTAGQLAQAEASFKNTTDALKEMMLATFQAADGVEQLNLMASTANYNAVAGELKNYGYSWREINKYVNEVENDFDLFRTKEEKLQQQLMAQEGTERARIALQLLEEGFEGSALALSAAVDNYMAAATHEEAAAARAQEMSEYYSQFAEEVTNTTDAIADNNRVLAQHGIGLEMSGREAEELAYSTGDLGDSEEILAGYIDEANQALADQEAAAVALAEAQAEVNARLGEYFDQALTGEEQTESLAMQLYNSAAAAGAGATELAILAAATGEFTDEQIEAAFQTALLQENITYLAEAVATGAINAETATTALGMLQEGQVQTAQEAINLQGSMNHAATALETAAGKAELLGDALDSLPTERTFTYTIKTDLAGFSLPPGVDAGDVTVKAGGIGLASGTDGWQTVPPGYPADSYGPIYLTSGEKFNVIPPGGGGGGSAGVTVGDIYINGMNNPAAAASEIITIIDQHYGAA
jgi:hypothetical protein